jgi:hypothetical protein
MKRGVNVLIIESSKANAARLIEIIMELEEINEILYAPSFDKPINLLFSGRVDIVLCSITLADENVAKLRELRAVCRPFYFVGLFKNGLEDHAKKQPLFADHLLNTEDAAAQLTNIIITAINALNKTAAMLTF